MILQVACYAFALIDKADHLHIRTLDRRLTAVQPREGSATNNVLVEVQYFSTSLSFLLTHSP
jgi:hypothetical protein